MFNLTFLDDERSIFGKRKEKVASYSGDVLRHSRKSAETSQCQANSEVPIRRFYAGRDLHSPKKIERIAADDGDSLPALHKPRRFSAQATSIESILPRKIIAKKPARSTRSHRAGWSCRPPPSARIANPTIWSIAHSPIELRDTVKNR